MRFIKALRYRAQLQWRRWALVPPPPKKNNMSKETMKIKKHIQDLE